MLHTTKATAGCSRFTTFVSRVQALVMTLTAGVHDAKRGHSLRRYSVARWCTDRVDKCNVDSRCTATEDNGARVCNCKRHTTNREIMVRVCRQGAKSLING